MTYSQLIKHMKQREKEIAPTLVRRKEQIKGMIALLEVSADVIKYDGDFEYLDEVKKFFDGRYPK